MRTYFSKQMKRLLSLILTLAICMTCMPLSAFADAAAARSAPVQSAPFEQPEPADYEAELRPVESAAQDGSVLPDGNDESTSPVSNPTPGSNSQPQGGASSESLPSESDAPADAAGSSEPGASSSSLPVSESASESTLEPSPDSSSSADSSSAQEETEDAQEAPSESQGTEDSAELRRPILRGGYDPYEAQYGAPVAMTRSARVFAVGRDAAGTEFKAVITATPNTYTNDAGEEATIDNTLVAAADGTYENAANDMKIDIPADPASTGVSVTANGYTVSLAPLEGDFSRPVVEENAIRFNDVLDGIDIQYTAKEMVLKEDIILLRPVERNAFRYRLDAPGLEARLEDGVLVLYKAGTQQAMFTILAPVMTDAAGVSSYDVQIHLEETEEGQIVCVTADTEWLSAPERIYPVLIDPSVQNTEKAAASMFTIGQSNFENGRGYAAAGLVQKKWAGYAGNENWTINRTMLYFDDISSFVPESGEVDKAELVLYEYEDLSGGKTVFTVSQLTKRLTFGDVQGHAGYSNHWDYFVANSTSREYLGRFTSEKGYKRVDITQTVNDWLKGIDGNYGLLLMADGEKQYDIGSTFLSKYGHRARCAALY